MKPQPPSCACSSLLLHRGGDSATSHRRFDDRSCAAIGANVFGILVGIGLLACADAAYAIEAKISGQVNRAIMQVDDGAKSETHHVDNDISGTRVRFTASDELIPGLKAGIKFEGEMQSNPSNSVSQTVKDVSASFGERQLNVYFDGSFGKLTLGQTDGAANGGTEVDLSGTDIAQGALGASAIGGGIEFTSGGVASGVSIGDVIDNLDFESRYDLLRYDTPSLGPVKISLSTGSKGNQDVKEIALSFNSSFAGGKLAGTLGTSTQERTTPAVDDKITGGSISWLSSNGINITFATSSEDLSAAQKGKFNYVKLGYKFGQSAISVDMGKGKDQANVGDEADVIGIAYVYKPVKWAEIYGAYKTHSLDRPGSNFDDITILLVGSRIKF